MYVGLRGSLVASKRVEVLDGFKALGVIHFATSTVTDKRRTAQYIVRIADEDAPWQLLDGREILPWLLGLVQMHARYAGDPAVTERLAALLEPFNREADEVPADVLAHALKVAAAAGGGQA